MGAMRCPNPGRAELLAQPQVALPLVVRSDSEAHHYRLLVEAAECVFATQRGLSKQVP